MSRHKLYPIMLLIAVVEEVGEVDIRRKENQRGQHKPPKRYEPILQALAEGCKSNKEIAARCNLTEGVVRRYISELYAFYGIEKTGSPTERREELIRVAQAYFSEKGFIFANWVSKPVSIVAGNGIYKIDPVECELSGPLSSLPVSNAELEQYISEWKETQAQAGKEYYNGQLAHLHDWKSLEPTEWELYSSLRLLLKETDYFTWQALTSKLRDKYPLDPNHPHEWKLPIPMGIELAVIANADPEHPELLILKRTGKDIGPYPGCYTVSVTGFMNLEKDRDKNSGKPDIYKTLCREAKEELHLEEIEEYQGEVIWLALAIDHKINSAALLGMVYIPKSSEELMGRIAQAKEGRHKAIPFTAQDVAGHIWRFHNIWEPHGTVAVILSLIYNESIKRGTRGAQDRVIQAFARLLSSSSSDRSSSRRSAS